MSIFGRFLSLLEVLGSEALRLQDDLDAPILLAIEDLIALCGFFKREAMRDDVIRFYFSVGNETEQLIDIFMCKSLAGSDADPLVKDDHGFSVEDWAKIEMYEGLAEVLDMLRRSDPRHGSRQIYPD